MAKTALAFLIKRSVGLVKKMIAGFPHLMLGSDAAFARFFLVLTLSTLCLNTKNRSYRIFAFQSY